MSTPEDKIKNLLSVGSEIAGAAVGGAVGFFAGGPAGAAGAGVLGVAAAKLLQDVAHRALSRREEIRVGATAAFAIDSIRKKIEDGQTPRDDGFFSERSSGTSAAEEVFEGVLQKAKNDHEEKKAQFYGKMFANIAFDPHCTPQEANYMLRLIDSLTFLQLVLLNIFGDKTRFTLRSIRHQPGEQVTFNLLAILSAEFDLFQRGLLRLQQQTAQHGEIVLEINQITPAYVHLTSPGQRLVQLASLKEISSSDINPVAEALSAPPISLASGS